MQVPDGGLDGLAKERRDLLSLEVPVTVPVEAAKGELESSRWLATAQLAAPSDELSLVYVAAAVAVKGAKERRDHLRRGAIDGAWEQPVHRVNKLHFTDAWPITVCECFMEGAKRHAAPDSASFAWLLEEGGGSMVVREAGRASGMDDRAPLGGRQSKLDASTPSGDVIDLMDHLLIIPLGLRQRRRLSWL